MAAPGEIRILVADDSEEFLAGLCAWVAGQPDFEVVGMVRDGEQAVEALDRVRPDVVLVDAVMPGPSGFATTRRIRARRGAPPVVILTLHDGEAAQREALEAGAAGFVAKSDLVDRLARVIRSAVSRNQEVGS